MELLIKDKLCDTTDEYIMEMETCMEEVQAISENLLEIFPSNLQDAGRKVSIYGSILKRLCLNFNAITKNYYDYKSFLDSNK